MCSISKRYITTDLKGCPLENAATAAAAAPFERASGGPAAVRCGHRRYRVRLPLDGRNSLDSPLSQRITGATQQKNSL